jgi:large subunit ribosomal protein L24
MALHVKKGDMVQIISGDHKGATGKVLRVLCDDEMVVVQGHNLAKKHVRPSQKNPQGGRINIEQPLHISKVLPVSPKSNKGSRVRCEMKKDGKHRVTVDGADLGLVTRKK